MAHENGSCEGHCLLGNGPLPQDIDRLEGRAAEAYLNVRLSEVRGLSGSEVLHVYFGLRRQLLQLYAKTYGWDVSSGASDCQNARLGSNLYQRVIGLLLEELREATSQKEST